MTKKTVPAEAIVLELAPLPREQVGPFVLLGVDKTAGREQIEAAWAQRVIWARKNQIPTPLEDVNWAREVINDPDRRIRADAASLNLDTADGVLRKLCDRYTGMGRGGSEPLDVEKPLADYTPPIAVPDADEIRRTIPVPEIPLEVPAVAKLLEEMINEPIDPWDLPFDSRSNPR